MTYHDVDSTWNTLHHTCVPPRIPRYTCIDIATLDQNYLLVRTSMTASSMSNDVRRVALQVVDDDTAFGIQMNIIIVAFNNNLLSTVIMMMAMRLRGAADIDIIIISFNNDRVCVTAMVVIMRMMIVMMRFWGAANMNVVIVSLDNNLVRVIVMAVIVVTRFRRTTDVNVIVIAFHDNFFIDMITLMVVVMVRVWLRRTAKSDMIILAFDVDDRLWLMVDNTRK